MVVTSRSPLFVLVAMLCGASIVGSKIERAASPATVAAIGAKPLNAMASLLEMKLWHLVTDVPRLDSRQRRRERRDRFERIGIISALPADWTEYTDARDGTEKNDLLERIGTRIEVVLSEPDRFADLGPYVGARRKPIDETIQSYVPFLSDRLLRPLTRSMYRRNMKQAEAVLPNFEFCEHEGGQTAWQLTVTLGVDDSVSTSVDSMTRDNDPVGRIARCVQTTMSRWFAGTVRSVPLHYTIRVW